MKKTLILLIAISFYVTMSFSEEKTQRFDVKFGTGSTLLGSGDMITIVFENEMNYKISKYFSSSINVNYGMSNTGVYIQSSLIQGNLNVFLSPFGNTERNNFKIGTGYSIMGVTDIYHNTHDRRTSYGYNIIIENEYELNEKYLIGFKLFTQQYSNRDTSSGIMLKFGVKLCGKNHITKKD